MRLDASSFDKNLKFNSARFFWKLWRNISGNETTSWLSTMPFFARTPLVRQQAVRTRFFAPSQNARGYHHLPFAWPKNKAIWGAKLALFLGTGFSIPFFAAWFQLRKAASN